MPLRPGSCYGLPRRLACPNRFRQSVDHSREPTRSEWQQASTGSLRLKKMQNRSLITSTSALRTDKAQPVQPDPGGLSPSSATQHARH